MGSQWKRRNSKAGTRGSSSSSIDRHVGARVRTRRIMLHMSQGDVAKQVGTTYQQFQKYEAGINRISASRLQQIANVLQVAPSFLSLGCITAGDFSRHPSSALLVPPYRVGSEATWRPAR
jgi:transcriptional regulator with XRE-family HTH domain